MSDSSSGRANPAHAAATAPRPQHPAGDSGGAGRRHWLAAAGWVVGCAALLAFFVRISPSFAENSDGANSALQAWDMLHGNLLLHGWILGDVTFYTLELPILLLTEFFFGLGVLSSYIASSVVYLIVVACATALAVRGSGGAARLARCGAAVAVLAIPLAIPYGLWVEIGPPDHMGTSAFILVSFLLIDRDRLPRWTAPLVGLILCAGQLSDVTVRYAAVPAIILVSAYRMAVARRVRTADGAIALAAAVSVPAELAVRAVLRHFGAYLMVAPDSALAPPDKWAHNAALAWGVLRYLFGASWVPGIPLHGALTILGLIALFAAAAGLVSAAVRWRTASRAEQALCLAIILNLAAYVLSPIPTASNSHEIAFVLPAGAVLAARFLVPARIKAPVLAAAAATVAAAAALVPLIAASTFPPATQPSDNVIAWLEAHHLSYGLADYWSASATTENAGGKVDVRTIAISGKTAWTYNWEMDTGWYDAAKYDANFVAVEDDYPSLTAKMAERVFGKPASIGTVPGWQILVYHKNLLTQVMAAPLPRVE
jgi:hypothetical protein